MNTIHNKFLANTRIVFFLLFAAGPIMLSSCQMKEGNVGNVQSFVVPAMEAQWIRDGKPLEFEGEEWLPSDSLENLLDSEVYFVGSFQGIQVFVEKQDVRPYNRVYTKFGKNRFRAFVKK